MDEQLGYVEQVIKALDAEGCRDFELLFKPDTLNVLGRLQRTLPERFGSLMHWFDVLGEDTERLRAAVGYVATSRLRARSLADLVELADPEWLIEGMIPETGTGTLYGGPYAGKTFTVIDAGLRIAMGMDYHGLRVKRGRVIHVAAEGSPARIRDRALAWCAANGVRWEDTVGWWSLVDSPVYLDDARHVEEWLDANRDEDGTLQRALIIFDTQARCMTGDENSAKDVGAMIKGIDRIRSVTGGFALRLHHEGRQVKVGGRGSTAGRGADDVTLHLEVVDKDKRVALITEDCRDGESGQRIVLDLKPTQFEIGGRVRHSLAMSLVASSTVEQLLVRLYEERPAKVTQLESGQAGFSSANIYKLIERARELGWVEPKPGFWLTEAGVGRAKQLGAREPAQVEFSDEAEEVTGAE